MSIKDCLEADHRLQFVRTYQGKEGFSVTSDGGVGELAFDSILSVDDEQLYCEDCDHTFTDEEWMVDGDVLRADSLENLPDE